MDTCSKSHEKFVDFDKCVSLIEELHTKLDRVDEDVIKRRTTAENLVESFRKVIDPYQEQPELLNPYLGELIEKLTIGLKDVNITVHRYHTIFKFLYQLIKVTGFKSIGQKFPHEADKLPLLIELLSKEDTKDKANWQTRFVLTVWLSIVILTPFDLSKFDSASTDEFILEKIYSVLTKSLTLHDSCQHVTAFCLAKFFSRPDLLRQGELLNEFTTTALKLLSNVKLGSANSLDDVELIGYLRSLAYMFKFVRREEMRNRCNNILDVLIKMDVEQINRELVNHLIIKLIQRAGLALLPVRIASWRYKRGSRILGQSADKTNSSVKPETEQAVDDCHGVSGEDKIAREEYLESIFNILFVATQNAQTRIRWSAAKGIARLAQRLSRERASDVIGTVVANFFDHDTSSAFAWHGGCLTLAEMSRNGLILEEKLDDVVRIVGDAIIYDKIKGSLPVGSHVREGACYVFWAMARVYEDHLLEPYISSISVKLLCAMLFDRELQCRRAASATFQELVGRQGTFNEEGIEILTNVDYQNVGQRSATYLQLAPQVAAFGDKYSIPFTEHLLDKKVGHWDIQIRRLASDSLSAHMLHLDHGFIKSEVLKKLTVISEQNDDNNAKHGAILSLAKVIRSLVPLQFPFEVELIDFVGGIVKKCEKQLKSKQQAPNFVEAIGYIISSAEVAGFNYPQESGVLNQWESIACSALDNDIASIRDTGSDALLTLYRTYYKRDKAQQDRILTMLNRSLNSSCESSRCGALRALSKLGSTLSGSASGGQENEKIRTDADTPDIILLSLTSYISKETREKSTDIVFAQAKAEACEAFVYFVSTLDKGRLIVSSSIIRAGLEALLAKTEDYTFDKRGDIGVVVRRAAVKALQDLTLYLLSQEGLRSILEREQVLGSPEERSSGRMRESIVRDIIARILQHSVSYNNSAREQAATAFYKLISALQDDHHCEELIPHKLEIETLLKRYQVDDEFNWRDDSTPIFVQLLSKPEYSKDLWTGLLHSVGQVSDVCANQFREALAQYIRSLADKPAERELVFQSFMATLQRDDMADRLLTSGLNTADYMLTAGLMNETSAEFQSQLLAFCWKSRAPGDPKRLVSVARVLCSMLQFKGSVQRTCLRYCLILLASGYAKVRAFTAEQLYQSIMTYQSELEENLRDVCEEQQQQKQPDAEKAAVELDLDEAMELLSITNWSEPLLKVKSVRDKICSHLKVACEPSSISAANV